MRLACVLATALVAPMIAWSFGGQAESTAASSSTPKAPINDCWPQDTNPPVVLDTTLSTTAVDSSNGPSTIDVTVNAKDIGGPVTTSGLKGASVWISAPAPRRSWNGPPLTVASAEQLTGSITVPQHTLPGKYVARFAVRDVAGNQQLSNADFTVINDDPDTVNPEFVSLQLTPDSVDTSTGSQPVTVTAVVSDTHSGVKGVTASLDFGKTLVELEPSDQPGTFSGAVTFPNRPGTAPVERVVDVVATDHAGNTTRRGEPVLVRHGNDPDPGTPRISSITVKPRSINVRKHPDVVTVTARVKDLTDVTKVWIRPRRNGPLTELQLVSGTLRDGVWRGRLEVSPCDQLADSRLKLRLGARDRAGRTKVLDAATVKVRRINRVQPWGHVVRPNFVPPKGPLVVKFQRWQQDRPVRVRGVSKRSIHIVEMHEFDPPYSYYEEGDTVQGKWRCFTSVRGHRSTRTSCAGDRVRRAEFTPSTRFPRLFKVDYSVPGGVPVTDRQRNPIVASTGCARCRRR